MPVKQKFILRKVRDVLHQDGLMDIVLVVGGAFAVLARHPEILRAQIVLAFDVESELAKIDTQHKNVLLLPMGQHLSLKNLLRQFGSEAQCDAVQSFGNCSTRSGVAQARATGAAATKAEAQSDAFQYFSHRQLVPGLRAAAGGELPWIRIRAYAGTAGGMGSRGVIELTKELANVVLKSVSADLQIDWHLLGSMTFEWPNFERTRENSGACMYEMLALTANESDSRISHTVHCHEVMPVGRDWHMRDQLIAEQTQAMQATDVEAHHELNRPNEALNGHRGNFYLVQSSHFTRLPDAAIVADASAVFEPMVQQALRAKPDLGLIEEVGCGRAASAVSQEAIDGILDRAPLSEVDDLLRSVASPSIQLVCWPIVTVNDGRSLALHDVSHALGVPISTVGAAETQLRLVRSISKRLEFERESIEEELDDVLSAEAKAERVARKAIESLQRFYLRDMLRTSLGKIERAERACEKYRAIALERYRVSSELEGIASAHSQLSLYLYRLEARLQTLQQILQSGRPLRTEVPRPRFVDVRPLDEKFPELMEVVAGIQTPAKVTASVQRILLDAVQHVTADGLAAILGAHDPSVESLVAVALNGKAVIRGPHWGGERRRDQPMTFVVLPPVAPELAEAIRKHFALYAEQDSAELAFAQTALGSVNAVVLELANCREDADIMNAYYRQGYEAALNSPLRDLFFLDPIPPATEDKSR